MSFWGEDSRLSYAIAAVLGMIAGVAAKQAVAITSGELPRPLSILADFLVLGMVWLIAMWSHDQFPSLSLEAIALLSAALAMWGPKGIHKLLTRFQRGALHAADRALDTYLPTIDPVHRPTNIEALAKERQDRDLDVESYGRQAPIRKLRDAVPLDPIIPADMVQKLGELDQSTDPTSVDPSKDKTNKGGPNAQ